MKIAIGFVGAIALAGAAYFWLVLSWSYSTGARAGWVQKLFGRLFRRRRVAGPEQRENGLRRSCTRRSRGTSA